MSDDQELDKIKDLWRERAAAFHRGSVEAWMATEHEDAVTFGDFGPHFAVGEPVLRADMQQVRNTFDDARFETSEMHGRIFGSTGILWGRYHFFGHKAGAGTLSHAGHFSAAFAKEGGDWRIVLSHFTDTEGGQA